MRKPFGACALLAAMAMHPAVVRAQTADGAAVQAPAAETPGQAALPPAVEVAPPLPEPPVDAPAEPPITTPSLSRMIKRGSIDCARLVEVREKFMAQYDSAVPADRMGKALLETALASYQQHNCAANQHGPSQFVVIDFARKSNEPRLWFVDLDSASGIDAPIQVTHGVGSDANKDGYAELFSNINDSLMSSLGAVRGAEIYYGKNGRSLRLDGLDATNNLIRFRDIVVHSVSDRPGSYFGTRQLANNNGLIGMSEGCFVVQRKNLERLITALMGGGFLFAGLSKAPEPAAVVPATDAAAGQGAAVN